MWSCLHNCPSLWGRHTSEYKLSSQVYEYMVWWTHKRTVGANVQRWIVAWNWCAGIGCPVWRVVLTGRQELFHEAANMMSIVGDHNLNLLPQNSNLFFPPQCFNKLPVKKKLKLISTVVNICPCYKDFTYISYQKNRGLFLLPIVRNGN